MKNRLQLLAFSAVTSVVLAATFSSCKKEEIVQDGSIHAAAVVTVGTCSANTLISSNTTWSSANTYVLRGKVRVQPGATLTIQAGTRIQGECDGTLIVERDADIVAIGTSTAPIVFTSNKATAKAPGDWGGIIILGRAQNNQGANVAIEGITVGTAGNNAPGYHGPGGALNNADNSGRLSYVRIEYAGQALSANNEINALTLGSVGTGTTLDHIQVLYGNDDSFEWFGGTVNASYLYSYGTVDDDFDTDFGYSGRVQFAAAVRVPSQFDVVSASNNSNGFESDNDAAGSSLTPLTSAIFANVTVVGPTGADGVYFGSGALLRRNTAQKIYNSVVFGYGKTGTAAVNASGANASAQVISSTLQNYAPGATTIPTGWSGLVSSYTSAVVASEPATGTTSFTVNSLVPPTFAVDATDLTTTTALPSGFFVSAPYRGAFSATTANNAGWNLAGTWLRFPTVGN
ncbi:cell shape-determining protein MreB [Cytophagaceae bacterium DM2B3-1]|uniref:Cell shape-determining protein MreB n=1 Tax=Xanthocytophaga flava TaxID=3048013 RepID=A0ABT7CJI5_9BACT|nr:cell shape-determining protein MreB [Xanthocytophaga flavus]MDJ1470761.1 cell shape-determining protein MreB [Xanthocytophaga flavus]MDJ1493160.1 cell shape-determining protein MreB [Xanthocytophaga flavus]